MSSPYIGEIRMFSGRYAPENFSFCDGTLVPLSQNPALYALIGTTYGGDGVSNFALPNFQSMLPVGQGSGPSLTPRRIGQVGGSDTVTLTQAQVPAHTHPWNATTAPANAGSPSGAQLSAPTFPMYYATAGTPAPTPVTLGTAVVSGGGANQSHPNDMPFLTVSFIIATIGLYPQAS